MRNGRCGGSQMIQHRISHWRGLYGNCYKPIPMALRLPCVRYPSWAKPAALLCVFFMAAATAPARADFRTCNETEKPLALAIAHSDGLEWVSEGWWTIQPHECSTILV